MKEWNDRMDWTGTVEWNGMECGSNRVLRHMRTWYHLSSYDNIIEILGLWCCIIRMLPTGRWAQGLEHSFAQ